MQNWRIHEYGYLYILKNGIELVKIKPKDDNCWVIEKHNIHGSFFCYGDATNVTNWIEKNVNPSIKFDNDDIIFLNDCWDAWVARKLMNKMAGNSNQNFFGILIHQDHIQKHLNNIYKQPTL